VEPALAASWTVSQDGCIRQFTLRRNVKFHDGTAFTAQHVVASCQRVLDPKTRGGRGWPLFPIVGATDFAAGKAATLSGLRVENVKTVEITLSEPFAIFPTLLAMPVASIDPSAIAADFGEHPVGTACHPACHQRAWKAAVREHVSHLSRAIATYGAQLTA